MVKLQSANCPLKPSQRRQLLSWLKRAVHLGERVGDFFLTITVKRVSRGYEILASVHDSAGDFSRRIKGQTWRDVCRALVRFLSTQLHQQRLAIA